MYSFSSLEEFSVLRETIKSELVRNVGNDALLIFVAINEGVNNAIIHGNKEDNSKKVYLTMEKLPSQIKIIIRDEGEGYFRQEVAGDLEEHGRGLEIMQHCMDSCQCNERGNEITLIKTLIS